MRIYYQHSCTCDTHLRRQEFEGKYFSHLKQRKIILNDGGIYCELKATSL